MTDAQVTLTVQRRCAAPALAAGVLVAGLVTGSLAGSMPPARAADAAQTATAPRFAFDVLRKGERFGDHSITLDQREDGLHVSVSIRLKVKFAFVTVFRYEHDNHEVWRDGRLVSLSSTTNRNGTDLFVEARRVDGGYEIETKDGTTRVEAETGLMPTSYWHPGTPDRDRLLNTQTGKVMAMSVTAGDITQVEGPGDTAIEARRYHLKSESTEFDLWYDADRCLAKIQFQAPNDGSTIRYRPTDRLSAPAGAALADHPVIGHCVQARNDRSEAS